MTDVKQFLYEYWFYILFGLIMLFLVCGYCLKRFEKDRYIRYTELREDKPPEYDSINTS
jgi:hypothetical protein